MEKNYLLKLIAEKAYDVGFGAKKHFATYDIVEKAPGWISFISTAVGILGLVIDSLSTKLVSAIFLIVGIMTFYFNTYDSKKGDYEKVGGKLTSLFSQLKTLYFDVKGDNSSSDFQFYKDRLSDIENEFYQNSISKQILFSNWYAHYKFFWEMQIDWITEQRKFSLFRDKIPLSFTVFFTLVIIALGYFFKIKQFCLQ